MRFFRPAVERALKVVAVIALISGIVVPVGWGYEQRQQARRWHQTACAYRLREVARATNFFINVGSGGDSCATLRQLGLDLNQRP